MKVLNLSNVFLGFLLILFTSCQQQENVLELESSMRTFDVGVSYLLKIKVSEKIERVTIQFGEEEQVEVVGSLFEFTPQEVKEAEKVVLRGHDGDDKLIQESKYTFKYVDPSVTEPVEDDPEVPMPVGEFPHHNPTSLPQLNTLNRPWSNSQSAIVIDAYESNGIDWDKMAADKRMAAVIHRSGDGLKVDKGYAQRREIARERGYLWGAYHLGRPGNVIEQADKFLDTVGNDDEALLILDLENTQSSSMMNVKEALQFIDYVYDRTGKIVVIYANHSTALDLNSKAKNHALIKKAPFWYARFRENIPTFPTGIWDTYFLWQFSSEINCTKTGSCLYNVPGTRYDMDVNVFPGTVDELKRLWYNPGSEN